MSEPMPIIAVATVTTRDRTSSAELTPAGWKSADPTALAILNASADPRGFGPDLGDPMTLACNRAGLIPGVTVDVMIPFDPTIPDPDDGRAY